MRAVIAAALLLMSAPAAAAPMWAERLAVPKSELVDARFEAHAPGSAARVDHSWWDDFLGRRLAVDANGVARFDYDAIGETDRAGLAAYIAALEGADVAALDRPEQFAFWINLYNAATVALILAEAPEASITDIDKPWDRPVANVSGRALSLNDIEHGIIRPVFEDARLHFAVNCASVGCPNLAARAYTGERLEAMLDAAARAFVNHPRGLRIQKGRLVASKIFGWYREDFGPDERAVIAYAERFAAPALARALAAERDIDAYAYDWSLNDRD